MNVQEDEDCAYDEQDGEMMHCMILFHMTNTLNVYSWRRVEVFDSDPRTCVFPLHTMVTLNNDAKISELLSTKCTESRLDMMMTCSALKKYGKKKDMSE